MSGTVSKVDRVRVTGPLAPFAEQFRLRLGALGYSPLTVPHQMRLMAQLSAWLEAGGFGTTDLTEQRVDEFLVARRASGYRGLISRRGLVPLLELLAGLGQLPPPVPAALSPVEAVLAQFYDYLVGERALRVSTAKAYVLRAGRFMAVHAQDGRLDQVTAADVSRAVVEVSASMSVGSTQMYVAALRSLLRFGYVKGLMPADVSGAALSATGRRSPALPRAIPRTQAQLLLQGCDRGSVIGRRDYAVLMLLLGLGLRAGEVAGLCLEDIDWHAGEITVRGKNARDLRLPLPADVGEAIVDYLTHGRPRTAAREVFLRANAPVGPIGRGGVSLIVRRACERAGIAAVGAHRLRHTLACQMVGAGVPLADIAQVLGHSSLVATSIYARIDIAALRGLARPWPGGPWS